MKELCDFLREKRQLLFFLLFFEGSLCLIYGLYGLPWGPAGYTCLVTAVVTLGFLMAGFFRWERKRRQLLILKRQAEQSLETADLNQLDHHRQARNCTLILNVGKIPPFNPNHFRQCFSCQTLCLSCGFDICTKGFKTGTIFNFRHIASPSYIV